MVRKLWFALVVMAVAAGWTGNMSLSAARDIRILVPLNVPMRDGEQLAADAYLPAGAGPWPVILLQTPYNKLFLVPTLTLGVGGDPLYSNSDYAFVASDWRGFWASAGTYYFGCPSRGEDGYDTVEWIAQQSWCDGNVGTWGPSALGAVQMLTAAEQPPHLRCCVPQVHHAGEAYELAYPGGVYYRSRNEFVASYFGAGLYRDHPLYDDVWRWAESLNPAYADYDVPMLHVSGWYDHQTGSTIGLFERINSEGGPNAQGRQRLIVGPWSHSHIDSVEQGELSYPGAEFSASQEALDCFDHYLRGAANGYESRPAVKTYQLNEDWRQDAVWPPATSQYSVYFLTANGQLELVAPVDRLGGVSFQNNPDDPAPTLFGAVLGSSYGEQGPGDLRPVEERDDVITFTSPPVTAPYRIAGYPQARLWVQCDAVDCDLAVRMTQVYPDGRSMLLTDGIRRVSLRSSYEQRELLTPDQIVEVTVELPPIAVTLPAGHALRISVAGANFDRFDKNMQDGSSLSDEEGVRPVTATLTVWCNSQYPSQFHVPNLEEPAMFGVRLDVPEWVRTGDAFSAIGWLDNSGRPRTGVPVVFLLDAHGALFFWPSFRSDSAFEYEARDIPPGSTRVEVISPLIWPDLEGAADSGLFLYGACLTPDMSAIEGTWSAREFGYGP